jgi:glycerol-3-phosphate dehydrogenase
MSEDTVNHAIPLGKLADRPCVTHDLRIHGYLEDVDSHGDLWVYGSDAEKIKALANESVELAGRLHPDLPYIAAEVVWAVREEMARSIEDVLARRTRALFLNARAAIAMAPEVARLLADELGRARQTAGA